jgi:hypothetical protein
VFLSSHAYKVRMMVIATGLAERMSRYLIDRIAATPNIELMTETELVALSGAAGANLEGVRWRDRRAGQETEAAIRNVFLFVGADPATEWLQGCVALDKAGFVITGVGTANGAPAPSPLESSVPGVFAVGDVRSGSVKRVGGAIGEGPRSWPRSTSSYRMLLAPTLTGSAPKMSKTCTHMATIRDVTERARLRGVPQDRRRLGALADLPHLRPCRLLRSVAEPSRDQALPRHPTSDH